MSRHIFVPGDIVLCVDDEEHGGNGGYGKVLEKNKFYIVDSLSSFSSEISLKGVELLWRESRFINASDIFDE